MEEDGIQLTIIAVNLVTANIPYSSNELYNIHGESTKDPTIKVLMHYINIGWPCECRKLPQELHLYWNFRDELSVKDELVTKGSRLLILFTLRRKMLEQIHEGHQVIDKCKQGNLCFGQELVMILEKQWESVEFAKLHPELLNLLEMSVKFHYTDGTPLEMFCSTRTKWITWWLVIISASS